MRSVLAGYNKWSPESIDNLTPRTALGHYNRIPKVIEVIELLSGGTGEEEDKDSDMDAIMEEAELLNLKPPKR